MKQNPCRYCPLSYEHSGSHIPSWRDECAKCNNRKKHREYLESQRRFVEGEPIANLQELLEQEWVMWHHSLKHIEVIKSNQLRTVLKWLEIGAFHKAIKKESEE